MKQLNIGNYSSKDHKLKAAEREVRQAEAPQQRKVTPYNPRHKKRRFLNKKIILLILVLILGGAAILGYMRLKEVNSRVEKYDEGGNKVECTNILNPDCWTDAFKPQLKQSNGFTNGLIIGFDTRKNQPNGLRNTDTIILFSFNHATQKMMLVSIPRDFYADAYRTKINAVYAYTQNKNKEDPYYYLKEMVTKVTGQPIQYFGYVKFDGVIDGINDIGGVQVCPVDSFIAQYPNPAATRTSKDQWLFYPFEKGCQSLDGEHALVYARFRYLKKGPAYLASDFSRARRQQEIIEGVKDKLLAQDMTVGERAEKYWSLLQSLTGSVYVQDASIEDVLAGLSFINTADRDPLNVVLDPNFGGLNKLIYATSDPSVGYVIRARDTSYKQIQNELNLIWKFPDFYKETPTILVRNLTGGKLAKDNAAVKLVHDIAYYRWYNTQDEKKTDKFAGMKLIDFTGGKKKGSLAWIQKYLGLDSIEEHPENFGITQTKRGEDFAIVIGPVTIPSPVPSAVPSATP